MSTEELITKAARDKKAAAALFKKKEKKEKKGETQNAKTASVRRSDNQSDYSIWDGYNSYGESDISEACSTF